jgi:hypothetical protein
MPGDPVMSDDPAMPDDLECHAVRAWHPTA